MCHSITRTLCRVCEKQIGEPQIAQIPCLPPTVRAAWWSGAGHMEQHRVGSGGSGYNRDYRDIASAGPRPQQDLDIAALARELFWCGRSDGDEVKRDRENTSFDESRVKQFFREYGHVNNIDLQTY
ncbi:hypothetical protein B0T24DRAFT_684084 [Lasiosphaeria ovina]|uniref:Uncharacterized protein n=1 Tax=Lasiosphaeria ovina TaxID=92902 RepID=A0AAE0MYL2_9PEZI|nr:hypothetical protein B0T24DRAFT_684084 [Lasiosphaeria ovina]